MVAFANRGTTLQPHPKYPPEEVVKIQLNALQHNDEPRPDAGIAAAWLFASPANKTATGPLELFVTLLHTPAYEPMLGYKSVSFGKLHVMGDHAEQTVVVTARDGLQHTYAFQLSKQKDAPYEHCWMTDSVVRV